ncbi:MAG: class II fumarate hydratase [Desulfobacterales bacterium]
MGYRKEKDSMGTVRVPATAYYGAQTQRAVENFPVSDLRLPPAFIHALALIKRFAAEVNRGLDLLDPKIADAISEAAGEASEGRFDDQFVIDVFQTGSGTSTNMNMNEVVAARANEILTGVRGGRSPVHPNDHVNLGQSSNDVIPSTIHIAAFHGIEKDLRPALESLKTALAGKAAAFADIRKIGRTHLQDAVPMTLGDEFSGYARQIELAMDRLSDLAPRLGELALGGTAVGTGINTHPRFAEQVIDRLSIHLGLPLREAVNHFQAQATQDTSVEASGVLRSLATALAKIANDLRWLASGPRCGIGEIRLPSLQPGSSIMPGKVNPVVPEAVLMAAAQVAGNDATIAAAGQGGNFELNTMLPVIAYNLLQSVSLLARASTLLAEKCVAGIAADRERCAAFIEHSLALVTALVPHIGYDKAAAIAKKAYDTGRTVKSVAMEESVLSRELLEKLLS